MDPDTDLDDYLEKASEIFPFISVEEQRRVGKNNIVKRHFKFTYDSPINHKAKGAVRERRLFSLVKRDCKACHKNVTASNRLLLLTNGRHTDLI